MRPIVARPDGEIEVLGGFRPAARSGGRLLKLDASAMIPLPEGTTLMHLPGRRALALDAKDRPVDVEADLLPVAAVLPVGHLRTLLPASRPLPGSRRLPLYGYAAVVEHHDELMVAALSTDAFGWWEPRPLRGRRPRRGDRERAPGAPGQPARRSPRRLRHRSALLHRAEHLPAPVRGSAARLARMQRRLPRLHLAADRRRGAGAPAADALRPHRRRARRAWRHSTSAGPTPGSSRSARDVKASRSRATTFWRAPSP